MENLSTSASIATGIGGDNKKRLRDDSDEPASFSLEAKRFRYDLLDILDDAEVSVDRNEAPRDLDSVMKSFEEEITMCSSSLPRPPPRALVTVDLTSESGDSQPDLGYLLEASDDELGLPPASSSSSSSEEEEKNEESKAVFVPAGLDKIWGFYDDEIPSYEFGISDVKDNNGASDFVALEGLFDYSDLLCAQSDASDLSWQPESLPAL